jgi:hypothetical protein
MNAPATPRTPAWALLANTFLNSAGTMVVTSGVYFLTKHSYGFSETQNYALGLVLGATYIAGALGAQPLIRTLRRTFPGLTTRAILVAMMLVMAVLCTIPMLARTLLPSGSSTPSAWPIWLLVCCYSPLTGVFWPLMESYVSGGIRGAALRTFLGVWNVVWSLALVFSSLAVAPFVEHKAATAVLALSGVHVLAMILFLRFTPEPAAHLDDDPHPTPASYPRLLVTFRMLLPMSYLVLTAMTPFLPAIMSRLGLAAALHTVVGAVWHATRTLGFFWLQRSHAWHGRWWLAVVGPLLMLAGFAAAVLSSTLATSTSGVVILIAGLSVFGLGMAAIYSGAIYYAMEVGTAQVDAGGKHEALIGVGYTAGPAIGLVAVTSASQGLLPTSALEPVVLAAVAGVALIVSLVVVRRVLALRDGSEPAAHLEKEREKAHGQRPREPEPTRRI